jgi:hypothetical protein
MMAGRMLITPHAAAFIDALFSTGINLTTRFVLRSVPRIVDALRDGARARIDVARIFEPMTVRRDRVRVIRRVMTRLIAFRLRLIKKLT